MTRMRAQRGTSLVEVLAALGLALTIAVVVVVAVATGLRTLVGLALRLESDDLAAQAAEALEFDVRRAGFDPRAAFIEPITVARTDRLSLQSDLDADGAIDPASEEAAAYACDVAGRRFSRILGAQSLPLAHGVTGCTLRFHDYDGIELVPPAGGLDAVARARIRLVTLDLHMVGGGLATPTHLRTSVALRGRR